MAVSWKWLSKYVSVAMNTNAIAEELWEVCLLYAVRLKAIYREPRLRVSSEGRRPVRVCACEIFALLARCIQGGTGRVVTVGSHCVATPNEDTEDVVCAIVTCRQSM
jgi:hypothetical protein